MAGGVQTPPPTFWPSPQESFAISQPSSRGPCGTVLKTHSIAPVVASAATTRPPGMWFSDSAKPPYRLPSWDTTGVVMR